MAGRRFDCIKTESSEHLSVESSRAFEQTFQTAMLLALLKRGLLDQRQFDLCMEEIKR